MQTRPSWWPRWVPIRCEQGHPLLPGKVSLHRCDCLHTEHHFYRCEQGCGETFKPEGCAG